VVIVGVLRWPRFGIAPRDQRWVYLPIGRVVSTLGWLSAAEGVFSHVHSHGTRIRQPLHQMPGRVGRSTPTDLPIPLGSRLADRGARVGERAWRPAARGPAVGRVPDSARCWLNTGRAYAMKLKQFLEPKQDPALECR
jgi:hypothetical protein